MKKNFLAIFIVIILGFPSYYSLFQKGFYYSHDDIQVRRVQETRREFKYLKFPIRWISGLSYRYGYPLFNFYSPFPYYLGALTTAIKGVDSVNALKITIILGFIFSSLSMFLLGKELFGTIGGIIAGVFYTYAPFHSVEIYVRGSLTEFWAFVPLPLILYSLKKNYFFLSSISIALLILSHHVLAILFSPILLLYLYFLHKQDKKNNFTKTILSVILGLGLSAFFWLPSFVESSLVRAPLLESFLLQSYKIYFLPLKFLLNMPWGYGGFSLTDPGAMSFEIGKIHLTLIVLAVFLILKNIHARLSKIIIFCLLGFTFSVFMVTPYSKKIWETVPYFIYTHFPWRYLAIAAFFSSVIAGYSVFLFKNIKLKIIFTVIIISALLITEGYKFKPKSMDPDYKPSNFDLQDTTTWEYQYLPIWLEKPIEKEALQKVEVLTSKAEITTVNQNPTDYSFIVKAEGFSRLRYNNYYFPGWNLYIDGKPTIIHFQNENNLIEFDVPQGYHRVQIKFEDTPIRKLGNLISLISSLIFLTSMIRFIKVKLYEKIS